MMGNTIWPEAVKIRGRVGKDNWYSGPHFARRPCCAAGCAFDAFGISHTEKKHPEYVKFRKAYLAAYYTKYPNAGKWGDVEACNDEIRTASERALVYNTAWALLGYTEGQSPEVLKLAAKAAKKAKK